MARVPPQRTSTSFWDDPGNPNPPAYDASDGFETDAEYDPDGAYGPGDDSNASVYSAGAKAGVGLFTAVMQKQAQEEAMRRNAAFQRELFAKNSTFSREQAAANRVAQAQQGRLGAAQQGLVREGQAIDQLLAVFERARR